MNIPASYLERISAVYPSISFDHLEFNQDGMVNDVIVVNQELVCRFAREDWGKEILSHETKARFWSGTVELQWANYALKNQDISLSLAHIGLARDIQPLGMKLS